ncbi:MAG: hypothetical protein F6K36_16365 [Symploca sp. SIO3C6]|uniref:Uncharacterized protein n=1 Tax=Symploca sp. SIO1C4 TaxID=2607765 RepID=A0A6B3ND28_9CYAN|nr:hypothetical protein [Symploca sp. SIO3C6]NER28004.1 hypothetical protein [Symploca sp. SIO1C4]NET05750.1 hypothetical protein [Symploca sp. SIO2B6]
MRIWQFWWRTLVLSSQYNPPEFIEHFMILWTLILGLWWGFLPYWPHLVLSASFALGAAMSMLVRELMTPSTRPRSVSVLAIFVLLSYTIYAFTQLPPYFS